MNEKDKTVEFNPVKDINKERINRNSSDVYSNARKNSYPQQRPRRKSNDNKGLIYLAIFLTVALIIAIVVGIIVITNTNSISNGNEPDENIVIPADDEEIEKEEEIVNAENDYNVIFYGETVTKKGDNYTIAADLYDDGLNKVGSRKITITPQTVIKESGKRMSAEGFVYTIESLTGEMISVEGRIREEDSVALSLSYDGSFREEIQSEEPTVEEENNEETTEENSNQENTQAPQNTETPETETAEQN